MPRDLPVGNGSVLVTFDASYQIRDIYYPHVGRENHSGGHPFRFGVWAGKHGSVEGQMSWVSSADWQRQLHYLPETLVTDVQLTSKKLGIELLCQDTVDYHDNVYLRRIVVRNTLESAREVRLFFHQDFHILESDVGDTAYYDPETKCVIHYKANRYFLIGCLAGARHGVHQFATGKKGTAGAEGTWRDAEDGHLSGNPIAQGAVDSTAGVRLLLGEGASETIYYWIAIGQSLNEVNSLHQTVLQKSPERLIERTRVYWHAWVNKQEFNFGNLPATIIDQFKRSLLLIRTQCDNGGAIVAANDTDIAQFSRDTYSYVWPRDAALVCYALDLAGYGNLTGKFYEFCRRIIRPEGYFLHKYTPDGNLASSWHPWFRDGERQLPIQEDETALVIWALWHHWDQHRNIELIAELYPAVIKRAADFMADYRDCGPNGTGLPLSSWDLWEERRGILTFTCAAVWAGLKSAARFAGFFGDPDRAQRYDQAAAEIRGAMIKHLYRPELGRFARMITRNRANQPFQIDATIDASLYAVFHFGVLDPDDEMVVNTMRAVEQRLWAKTPVGGLARYENDYYHQVSTDVEHVAGNPWILCTLWLAQYRIATADTLEKLESSLDIMEWALARALPSGVMAEQVNPYTNQPLSVSPLTWSHATFVTCVMEYLRRLEKLVVCDNCGRSMFRMDRHGREVIPDYLCDHSPALSNEVLSPLS